VLGELDTDIDDTLGALSDLVHQGKVRMIGCCTFPPSDIVDAYHVAERRGHVHFSSNQPPYSLFVRGIERELDVLGGRARDLREDAACHRAQVVRVRALHGRDPLAADEVLVALLHLDGTARLARRGVRLLLDGCHRDAPLVGRRRR